MGLPQLKADNEMKDQGFFDSIFHKSFNDVLPKNEVADDYAKSKEESETKTTKKSSSLDRKTYANNVIPINYLGKKIDTHTETDEKRKKLSAEVASQKKLGETLTNPSSKISIFSTKLVSKISGGNIEKDVKAVMELGGNEAQLGGYLDKFEKVEGLKDKIDDSFLGKIFGFFGNKMDFNPDEFLNEKGKMKSLGKYMKEKWKSDGVKATIMAPFVYASVRKFKKPLELYRPVKRIIDAIGGVVERVENMGAKASDLLKKFNPSREKVYLAQKMLTKAPNVIASFIKNPKKQSAVIIEFLKKGNAVPGFAEKLKEKKIKGFKFRGSGTVMIAILSQKVISEVIEEDDLENPETFSQKWVPGVALFQREWPNLKMAIEQKGLMNSKTELASFVLQAGFDILTVWAIVALIFSAAPAVIGVGVALRRGGLVALKKLIGKVMTRYGKTLAKKGAKKQILKKATSFALTTGGPVALNYAMATIIPKINEKVIETVKSQGSVVARQMFTSQQIRAYDMYKGIKG